MQEAFAAFLKDFPMYLNTFIEVVGAITIVASVVVKLTPTPDDDAVLEGFKMKWYKFLAWLPTVGYNAHQDVVAKKEEKTP